MAQKVFASVTFQRQVSPTCYRLGFFSEFIAREAKAGQFVHILAHAEHVQDPLLRRAFSILSTQEDTFEILYKNIGKGTDAMKTWQTGQIVDIIGPLGCPFVLPEDKSGLPQNLIFVGGGVGVPPLVMLAANSCSQTKTCFIGAYSKDDIMCSEDFAALGVPTAFATIDGSVGHKGLVTELLQAYLEKSMLKGEETCVYSCGPLPMLRAVAMLCLQANVPCQISLEENMPCGIGICNGCVVPVTGHGDDYGRYRRICVEGPVMLAKDIDWSHWEKKAWT